MFSKLLAPRDKLSIRATLLLGLLFHLVYTYSIFDCYFTSPVVHGMQHFNASRGEAKRLVLFVADGLRADLLYNVNPFPNIPDSPSIVAPYLHDIIQTRGAFGISHTRVPTESRPGHVAIIGGMYEDVSAVTRGWKTNPVHFDSVFNQSRHTFSFGSPDILPMFAQGTVPGKVDMWMYNEEDEDFTKDATELDEWVYIQLSYLFERAKTNGSLASNLHGPNTIFFLHLLGLDTTGHSYRPHSKEYMRNIQVVDAIVARTEQLFQDFYQDNMTSFIFTADHGMSNIGNHGDGNPDSTRTPFIAWGKGIRGPLPDTEPSSHDAFSAPWNLTSYYRCDIEQADIAPLMSGLLGINFPANSVGVLPGIDEDRVGYLSLEDGDAGLARVAVANAMSILEHFRVKHYLKASYKAFFVPFSGFPSDEVAPGSEYLRRIEQFQANGHWKDVRKESRELIHITLEGLRYLETYDRVLLRSLVTFGYLGWSAFSATSLFFKPTMHRTRLNKTIDRLALVAVIAFYSLFALQHEPWTYYLYVTFPCYFWWTVASRVSALGLFQTQVAKPDGKASNRTTSINPRLISRQSLRTIVLSSFALQMMAIAYKHRPLWSIGLVIMGIVWPLVSWPERLHKIKPDLRLKWAAACLVCAMFPLRDVEQKGDIRFIIAGGLSMILFAIILMNNDTHCIARVENLSQLALTVLAILITVDSNRRLAAKQGLPVLNQISGWVILVSSVVLPAFFPFRSLPKSVKLTTVFLMFAPTFVLLSIAAEGLFYLCYCATLLLWLEVEAAVRRIVSEEYAKENGATNHAPPNDYKLSSSLTGLHGAIKGYSPRADDVRIALYFLFFVQIAFFGTGNVASVSSFYLEPVFRLVPVFSPFIMASLLVFKIVAPFVMLAVVFAALNSALHLPPFALFLIALSLTDGMTITFFVNVKDTGSWLEIGQSISFFVIASLLLVWSAGVCALGEWLMNSPYDRLRPHHLSATNVNANGVGDEADKVK